jgi:hypothetical protein
MTMDEETCHLIRDLAGALLDLISDAQAAQDVVFDEHSHGKEAAVYDRAVAWLKTNRSTPN